METKGLDSGVLAVLGLERLQWKWWGQSCGVGVGVFTDLHIEPPTPSFPLEPVSRTNRCSTAPAVHS
jgi:hypothetical protein